MLQEMMERVLDRWDRVRRFFFTGVLVHRAEQAQREHHALLEAMRARDWERLDQTIRAHNRGALADYTAYLEAAPGPRGSGAEAGRERELFAHRVPAHGGGLPRPPRADARPPRLRRRGGGGAVLAPRPAPRGRRRAGGEPLRDPAHGGLGWHHGGRA